MTMRKSHDLSGRARSEPAEGVGPSVTEGKVVTQQKTAGEAYLGNARGMQENPTAATQSNSRWKTLVRVVEVRRDAHLGLGPPWWA